MLLKNIKNRYDIHNWAYYTHDDRTYYVDANKQDSLDSNNTIVVLDTRNPSIKGITSTKVRLRLVEVAILQVE